MQCFFPKKRVCLYPIAAKYLNIIRTITFTNDETIITPDNLKQHPAHYLCLAHIKKYDRENYLAALCINDKLTRRLVVALRAFNVELSLIRDSTTNSDRAKLRLNFWAKLIDELIRRNKEHTYETSEDKLTAYYNYTPVARELLELFHLVDIDESVKVRLQDLIGARLSSKVMGYQSFETMSELELYCSKSNASVYHLAWILSLQLHQTWHVKRALLPKIRSVADNLGVAHGLSNVIRGIPYNSTKNCCYVPKDIVLKHNLTTRDFISKSLDSKKVAPVVEELAERCQNLVDEAYSDTKNLPSFFRQIFLPRVSIHINLRKLKKCNYNICDPILARRDGLLPFNLWMASKFWRSPFL